ncbi:MAG: LacI family DNA-binding transcriptional regulator [Ktedonobacteraceae bacterium]|nr:LacI family DNA-binding transcriptional regulator [Ktedonobacteraceae bacterium]
MVTIYDIAKAAGVAKSTVANALSGKGTVSEATRQRVLHYAKEMGYRPNVLARSFSNHKTLTIALVLPTITNPFYPEIVGAIEQTASERDYQILFSNTHLDFALGRQRMERMMSRWVDGYIIMGCSMDIADVVNYFQQGLPIVLCDWQENEVPQGIPQVSVDFYRAGQLAAQHLLDLGHRNVAVISDEPQQTLRMEGFVSVLQAVGLTLSPSFRERGDSTLESGYDATKRLLQQQERPTAIFAATDWMAFGAMNAVQDAGLRVPQDVSIIGLDDVMLSAHLRPPLTTVAVPKIRLAREATNLLFRQIDGEKESIAPILVEPYLIVRQSTTCPRERHDDQ